MAAGSSAPELATVIIGVFFAKDDIGVSGVIGSGEWLKLCLETFLLSFRFQLFSTLCSSSPFAVCVRELFHNSTGGRSYVTAPSTHSPFSSCSSSFATKSFHGRKLCS